MPKVQELTSIFSTVSGSAELIVETSGGICKTEDQPAVLKPHRYYRPELDVLRFMAFLMVYVGHTLSVDGSAPALLKALKGFAGLGVPLFFALSAYLVTELLTMEERTNGSINILYFYGRRILRIWPLYFVVLGFGFYLSHVYGPPISMVALLAYAFLVGNWYTGSFGYLSSGVGPLWSIPIEEQFYLLWPLVLRRFSRRTTATICALAWFVSQAALIFLCSRNVPNNPSIWTNSLVQLQYFATGAGLSLFLQGAIPRIRTVTRLGLFISALLLFLTAEWVFNTHQDRSSINHTFPQFPLRGVAILMLLLAILGWSSIGRWRSLRFLGKISYGLYVYHALSFQFAANVAHKMGYDSALVAAVAGLSVDIGVAWLSYEYLEKPFLRLKEKFAVVKSAAI